MNKRNPIYETLEPNTHILRKTMCLARSAHLARMWFRVRAMTSWPPN